MRPVIILPTYNEKGNIEKIITEIFKTLQACDVIVIDDNSPDGTQQIVQQLKITYPHLSLLAREGKQGLGKAYLAGFEFVKKTYPTDRTVVIMMDADLSHPPEFLLPILQKTNFYNLVVGSRYIVDGNIQGWNWRRKLLSRLGNFYCRLITGLPIHDCTGGFNAISLAALNKVDLSQVTFDGYAFQIGLKNALLQNGASYTEVPITFRDRIIGISKISLKIIIEGIIAPWKIRFDHTHEPIH